MARPAHAHKPEKLSSEAEAAKMALRINRAVAAAHGLNHADKAMLFAMATHVWGDGRGVWASQATLAREAGLKNRETANRVLKRLEQAGLIHNLGKSGSRTTHWAIDVSAIKALKCDSKSQDHVTLSHTNLPIELEKKQPAQQEAERPAGRALMLPKTGDNRAATKETEENKRERQAVGQSMLRAEVKRFAERRRL